VTRRHLATGAALLLVLLTLVSWQLSERDAGSTALAVAAALKLAVIGGVFLELDRSRPLWAVLAGLLGFGILGGAVLLMGQAP